MKTHKQNTTTLGGGVHHNLNTHLKKSLQSPHIITAHEHVRTKSYLYSPTTLTLLVLVIFLLISCGVNETTSADTGGGNGTAIINTVITVESATRLKAIVEAGNLNGVGTTTTESNPLIADTLSRFSSTGGTAATTVKAIYVTENGAGTKDGTSWANAINGNGSVTNLRTTLTNITDASSGRSYVVLVAGGTYKTTNITTTTDDTARNLSFSMTNYTAIVGGFGSDANKAVGNWTRSATTPTVFDGNIGDADETDNTKNVFSNGSGIDRTAVLYGVVIQNGYTDNVDSAAGMFNNGGSPAIINVVFNNNKAKTGGGVYNVNESPYFNKVVFVSNSSTGIGGSAMFNVNAGTVIENVVFVHNTTGGSGTIRNNNSSPLFINVSIISNTGGAGAGIYDITFSTATLINTTIVGNIANTSGGFRQISTSPRGAWVINSILWDNNPNQIYLNNATASQKLLLAASHLQGGTNAITSQVPATANTVIDFNNVTNTNSSVSMNTFGVPVISTSSPAVNKGLYVKIDGAFANDGTATGATLYMSEDATTWYTNIDASGLSGTPFNSVPSTARDITAKDITGHTRTLRPDAGAYEAR